MENKKPDAEHVWKQLDDVLVPGLRLSVTERGVYSHLLRHSRLEGKAQIHFSLTWLARGALRLVKRNNGGHTVEVRLPDEILRTRQGSRPVQGGIDLEADFLTSKALRQAIHSRERGFCFYCLRRLTPLTRCLDHVVPRVSFGSNSYRNLASCCVRCNFQKRARAAEDFLRWLYRQRRLTEAELTARLRALDALAAGKLRPSMPGLRRPANP